MRAGRQPLHGWGLLRLLFLSLIVDGADLRSTCQAWLLPKNVARNQEVRLWGGALETVVFGCCIVCAHRLDDSGLGGPWP